MQQTTPLRTLTLGSTRSFRAMGVSCSVTVVSAQPYALIEDAIHQVARYEQLWSRFLPTSDITRLNSSGGTPTRVDGSTLRLIAHMQAAVAATDGSFNPTLLPLQLAAGDSDSLVDGNHTPRLRSNICAGDASRLRHIVMGEDHSVTLPADLSLDAGGIGKGLAADLVAEDLLAQGADAVAVNLGGDVRIASRESSTLDWPVTIASPWEGSPALATLSLRRGAVATSVRHARRRRDSGISDHIFSATETDDNTPIAATIVASTAAWAEAWTKHALIAPVERTLDAIDDLGLAAMIVRRDGTSVTSQHWNRYCR